MSTYFSFYTKITLKQVKEETSIKVIEHDDNTFLEDTKGNKLVVNKIQCNCVKCIERCRAHLQSGAYNNFKK